ncbi:hypothetical protein BpHYR1_046242 [Brachionus plicatilis]|uniref:Uncharacterized protein n=1 Tax=Brachionus plicatilis TaxID=10195 RepID=A0A3M7PGI8_BRAPC|nr:hypothetical protein BpHYR1_046242 [Brachionus plicatilis]
MRNLYQSPSPSISHQHSYPGASQIDTVHNNINHGNQTSPKIIQVHNRGGHSPSTCFVNKQAFFQAHQSPKIKSLIQSSGLYNQSGSELVRAPVPKAFKLSSPSVSSYQDSFGAECHIKASCAPRAKNSSPLIVSSCSSSSSSASPSPVAKSVHEHQNERFFDSNTLYKRELKQKQRDILSTSVSSACSKSGAELSPQKTPHAQLQLQKLQQSLLKHELERQICELSQSHIESSQFGDEQLAQGLSRDQKRSTLPHNLNSLSHSPTSNNNKVLNLFTNLLNRNKSEPNYLSVKNLKRATSSTHFAKSKTADSTSPKSTESKSSLGSLFKLNKSEPSGPKMRRSLDDVGRLHNPDKPDGQSDTFISLDNKKYHNTAFSSKNNGLIFLAPQSPVDTYENLDNWPKCDTAMRPFGGELCQVAECAAAKPSEQILKRINSLTKKNSYSDEPNAFDNVVYSYVDNIRHHSKRLSQINALNSSAIAAASAAAAAAVSTLANANGLSCSSGSSSSNSFHSAKCTDAATSACSNVMTLREKFESIGCESPKASLKSVSVKSDGLSVNTSVSTANNRANLNSPALSSVSSASSRSSAISSSLSSGSFSKDLPPHTVQHTEDLRKMAHSESRTNSMRIVFNYYFEFYRFNLSADESHDQKFKSELESIRGLNQKLLPKYDKVLAEFVDKFYANNVLLKNVLDPILADCLSTYSSNSSLFNFKFTIEFFKPILSVAKMSVLPCCSANFNAEAYQMIDERGEPALDEKFSKELNLNLYQFDCITYSQLFKELGNARLVDAAVAHGTNLKADFDILKTKLLLFILYKLEYFNDEIRIVQRATELNDKLGVKAVNTSQYPAYDHTHDENNTEGLPSKYHQLKTVTLADAKSKSSFNQKILQEIREASS